MILRVIIAKIISTREAYGENGPGTTMVPASYILFLLRCFESGRVVAFQGLGHGVRGQAYYLNIYCQFSPSVA